MVQLNETFWTGLHEKTVLAEIIHNMMDNYLTAKKIQGQMEAHDFPAHDSSSWHRKTQTYVIFLQDFATFSANINLLNQLRKPYALAYDALIPCLNQTPLRLHSRQLSAFEDWHKNGRGTCNESEYLQALLGVDEATVAEVINDVNHDTKHRRSLSHYLTIIKGIQNLHHNNFPAQSVSESIGNMDIIHLDMEVFAQDRYNNLPCELKEAFWGKKLFKNSDQDLTPCKTMDASAINRYCQYAYFNSLETLSGKVAFVPDGLGVPTLIIPAPSDIHNHNLDDISKQRDELKETFDQHHQRLLDNFKFPTPDKFLSEKKALIEQDAEQNMYLLPGTYEIGRNLNKEGYSIKVIAHPEHQKRMIKHMRDLLHKGAPFADIRTPKTEQGFQARVSRENPKFIVQDDADPERSIVFMNLLTEKYPPGRFIEKDHDKGDGIC